MKEDNRFKLAVCSPVLGRSRSEYTFSLAQMIFYFSQNQIYEGVENQIMQYQPMEGSNIGALRQDLVKLVLQHDYTHILFIDDDMSFAPETLHILAGRKKRVVGCNYPMRIKDAGFVALSKDCKRRLVTNEKSTGLEECFYTGFGFCLIDVKVFDLISKPWFLVGYNLETEIYTTEDTPFAKRLMEAGITWWCDHDASKLVGHNGNYTYTWRDYDDSV